MKRLLLFAMLIMSACVSYSQSDTVCPQRKDVIRNLERVERLKVDSVAGVQAREKADSLTNVVADRDNTIKKADAKIYTMQIQQDVDNVLVATNHANAIAEKDKTIEGKDKVIKKKNKTIGKLVVGGGAVIVGLGYLVFAN